MTATDLVLTVTEILRETRRRREARRVLRRGLSSLPLADRATIGNMSPEYGATVWLLPRRPDHARLPAVHGPRRGPIALVEAYCKENLFCTTPTDRAGVHADRGARPLRRRAEPRRPASTAGPRPADGREAIVPGRARELRRRLRERARRSIAESFPRATRPPIPRRATSHRHSRADFRTRRRPRRARSGRSGRARRRTFELEHGAS